MNMPASGRAPMARLDIDGERHATATERRPEAWLMRVESLGHGIISDETLLRSQMADEFLLMGLRLAEGIDPTRYERLAGRPLDPKRIAILHAGRRGGDHAGRQAAGDARGIPGARRRGGRSRGADSSPRATYVPEPPNDCAAPG